MGSRSDYSTMEPCVELLREFEIPYESRIVSAHRTPDLLFQYAGEAEGRGLKVIIAAAGGAAHLPGMVPRRRSCRCLACPFPRRASRAWTRCCRSCRCRRACPSARSPSASPARPTPRCSPRRFSRTTIPSLRERLRAWRAARTRRSAGDTEELVAQMTRDPPRRHHRHPRRRPARPHDRAWRRARLAIASRCSIPIPTVSARPVVDRCRRREVRDDAEAARDSRPRLSTSSRSRSSRSRPPLLRPP